MRQWVYTSVPGLAPITPRATCLVPFVQHYIHIAQSIVGLQKTNCEVSVIDSDGGTK